MTAIPNKSVIKYNYSLFSGDGIHNYAINHTLENLVVFTKMWVYYKFKVPADEHDAHFKKEILTTVVDLSKATKQLQSNIIIARMFESAMKAALNETKFPLKKVYQMIFIYFNVTFFFIFFFRAFISSLTIHLMTTFLLSR